MTSKKNSELEHKTPDESWWSEISLKTGRVVEISKAKVKIEIERIEDNRTKCYYETYPVSLDVSQQNFEDELTNLRLSLGKKTVLILVDGEVTWIAEPSEDGYFLSPESLYKKYPDLAP